MKMQDKPCCNSKAMGLHLAQNMRIRLARIKKKLHPDLALLNLLFFSISFCGKWVWSLLKNAMPSVFLASKSWKSDLSVEVSFASVLATVLSEYWKKLEEIFFWNDIIWGNCENNIISKKILELFFYILKKKHN